MPTRLALLLAALWLALGAFPAQAQRAGDPAPVHYTLPAWFKQSFLDFREDVAEARGKGKQVMVFFHLDNCPWCARLLRESFEQGQNRTLIEKRFDVVAVNVRGAQEAVWTDGRRYTERSLTSHLKVRGTPTLVILGGDGAIAHRVDGYIEPGALRELLAQSPHTHEHRFDDAEKWAHVFDDPKRDAWQKPHQVIQALALEPGAVVADIGAGTGYFAVRLANMVPKGKVYAVDTEPDMVRFLAERAKREGRANLLARQGAPADPGLPEKADLIVLVDVYHHIDERERYFSALAGSLKPGGRLAIIDFRMDSRAGPPKAARIAPQQVIRELKKAGYALAEQHDFLPNQYFLVFRPRS